ncbi:MAG: hypothetical protein P1P82_15625 [Bacteroidales bacterium]|nr:hypothetical protein [Bacteroidales bacterium]MDT8430740.1 hypothetical protein [Bacteroidales bacterium]
MTQRQDHGSTRKDTGMTTRKGPDMSQRQDHITSRQAPGITSHKEPGLGSKQVPGMSRQQEPGNTTRQDHGITRQQEYRVPFPKMILVAGDGRNVGKTVFCMHLIRNLSAKAEVIAIKTTPHRHNLTDGLEVIAKTGDYIVALEKAAHQKDSARLLQAGAGKVYLVMADQQHVGEAFSHISDQVQDKICVAESGSLAAYVQPGYFFFIKNHTDEIKKKEHLEFNPVVVTNVNHLFDFAPEKLDIVNNELRIAPE